MARLIDAEHLAWNVKGIKCGTLTVKHLLWILENQEPTVEAIPIEWIENYLRNYRYMAPIEKSFVREMLKAWAERKEE